MEDFYQSAHDYSEKHSAFWEQETAQVLQQLERATHLETLAANMLSGSLQGQWLSLLSELASPKLIVEIGTFTGYSAICLAQGLQAGGQLHTVEIDEEKAGIIQRFIQKANLSAQIQLHIADAKTQIAQLPDGIDLSFIDADKQGYELYYELLLPKTRTGGLIVIDNVLWHGKVWSQAQDSKTVAIQRFNQKINADNRVKNLLLPLRDGLMIVKKR